MSFDFSAVSSPFRMQPGLRRLPPGAAQLTSLVPGSALHEEKRKVLASGNSRLCATGFDPVPALAAITDKAREERVATAIDNGTPLELAFAEDFAVLHGDDSTLPWLCVCVPSHWAPEDKLGLTFAAVHAPVADNGALQAAGAQLVRLVTGGACWERFVWTVSPSPCFDQHPRRHARQAWPVTNDAAEFAANSFLRAERQTFFPVGRGTRQAVFTIRVMLQPLTQAASRAMRARRLRDAIASMSDSVLAYKGMAPAREPLLRWLDTLA